MPADPNSVVSFNLTHPAQGLREGEDSDTYWTVERMTAAEPMELKEEEEAAGLGPTAIPLAPKDQEDWNSGEPNIGAMEQPPALIPPFNTRPVGNTGQFPYSAVGKLFARVNGVPKFGTAFVVSDRCVVSAGHCVYDDVARAWVDMVAFAPRFADGAPAGLWKGVSLHTLAGWAAQVPNARAFDMGGVILEQPVSPVTGVIGWYANIPPAQGPFHSVGYPIQWISPQYPFDGKRMWWCTGAQIQSSGMLRMANNMTTGASGGPWLIQRNDNIYVNGLNSFRLSNESNVLASPYFGQGFINLMARLTH